MNRPEAHADRSRVSFVTVTLTVLTMLAGIVFADDRDLLRERAADPNVMIIFDTSGSMHWSPVCNAEDACDDIDPYDGACTAECEFGDTTCSQICPDFGCVEFGDADVLPPITLEVDDLDMAQTTIVGAWPMTTNFTGAAFMGSAVSDNDTDKGSKSFTFNVPIAETRRYKVFLSVPQSELWASNVQIRVRNTPDAENTVLDQRFVPPTLQPGETAPPYDPWKLVGVYQFDAGSTARVTIRNNGTNGPVVADGIRLVSEVKQCLRQGFRCITPLCPTGDCRLPMNQDDPGSKFFQAKQALYEVVDNVQNVRLGFATFEQDRLRVHNKHWLYRVREREIDPNPADAIDPPLQNFINLPGGVTFPSAGEDTVFGRGKDDLGWACNSFGCTQNFHAFIDVPFERALVHRYPKLGVGGTLSTQFWFSMTQTDPDRYSVTWSPVAGYTYGDPQIEANVSIFRCPNNDCSALQFVGSERIAYDLRGDFVGREIDGGRRGFGIASSEDAQAEAGSTCGHASTPVRTGWDPNNDEGPTFTNFSDLLADKWFNINLRWPTSSDPRSTSANFRAFDEGDVIPWDWLPGQDHADEIKERLAPNTVTSALNTPDFRVARYLNDQVVSGELGSTLRLADSDATDGIERPLIAWGSTPLGGALNSVDKWFEKFRDEAESGGTVADPVVDSDWSCRERFVLLLTDGDETCQGINGLNPCTVATTLNSKQVDTFVVGFGLRNAPGNSLQCIAANGGTQEPFFPRNKDELVDTLSDIFGDVQARARSFASAALPAVQATAADKVLFSSFTPLTRSRVWPGRVDVIRQPVVDTIERMVCLRNCDANDLDSGCHIFNAGDTILAQGPTDLQIDDVNPDANLGEGRLERRVFYPLAYRPVAEDGTLPQPLPMRLFELPDLDMPTTAEEPIIEDLMEVIVRPSDLNSSQTLLSQLPTFRDEIKESYRNLFRIKNSTDLADSPFICPTAPSGAPPSYVAGDYLLGDVFHTTTTVASGPSNLEFRRQDLCGAETQPTPNNCVAFPAAQIEDARIRGYRNFVRRGGWYRNMLTVGANDGQLHFFDAGVRAEIDDNEVFTDGTGAELFSFIPRLVMPIVREQMRPSNDRQIFSMDGSFTIDDVFVDPEFTTGPDASHREWRRVLVGGLREAGDRFDDTRDVEGFVTGYYALDITQPDGLVVVNNDVADPTGSTVADNQYIPDNLNANGVLPSCLDVDADGNLVAKNTGACRSAAGAELPFPAFKWEFADRVFYFSTTSATADQEDWYLLDEDRNGEHDLANTWSRPLIGQVRVTEGGSQTVKWVAIFGGGISPNAKDPVTRGNYLYMVDIETGTALYKRPLVGAAPADVTGTVDEQGIFNALYIGTTAGFMYKVDLRESIPVVDFTIEDDQILGWPDTSDIDVRRVVDERWDPFAIFSTNGKPIYQTPALVQVPVLDQVALAWGTGDREDLWDFDGEVGRFYVIVDDDFERPIPSMTTILPLDEPEFVTFDFNAPLNSLDAMGNPLPVAPDFLTDEIRMTNDGRPAARGWIMRFPVEARVTTRAFAISGVLVYTVFQPRFDPLTGTDEPCRRSGLARTFVVDVRNGDPLTTLANLRDASLAQDRALRGGDGVAASGINVNAGPPKEGDCGDRCLENEGLPTAPSVEGNATPNPVDQATNNLFADPLDDPVSKRLLENIKRNFFPAGCQFNDTFVHRIRMQLDNTELRDIAPVPIGVCPSDWKEGAALWSEDSP